MAIRARRSMEDPRATAEGSARLLQKTLCFFGLRAAVAVVTLARHSLTIMHFRLLPGRKKDSVKVVPLVKIIEVKCPKCRRKFRTVPTVVEHAGEFYCPVCSSRMKVSQPQPVSVLARGKANSAA